MVDRDRKTVVNPNHPMWSFQRFEVRGWDAHRGQRLINRANDVQQGAAGLSGNLEHPHQPVSIRQGDYDKPGMVDQTRGDRFAHCQLAQEVGSHSKVGSG